MKTKWIGLTGKMGAGKDYAFTQMLTLTNGVFRVSFADQLRKEICAELGMDEFPPKPYTEAQRRVQQWWGTDFRREQDPNYWVKMAEEEAKGIQTFHPTMTPVFTDVRFPNEADMIRNNGGFIVEVVAPIQDRQARLGQLPDHESEHAMEDYMPDMYLNSVAKNERYHHHLRQVLRRARVV